MRGIEFNGRVTPQEQGYIEGLVNRLGFEVEYDGTTGLLSATRPDVITREEFRTAAIDNADETPLFASVVWGTLVDLFNRYRRLSENFPVAEDIPTRFIYGGWNGRYTYKPSLLVLGTLQPTVDWLEDGNAQHFWGMTERKISAMKSVSQSLPIIE